MKLIKCPVCNKDVAVSGSKMHVMMKHPEKYTEFCQQFKDLKAKAFVKMKPKDGQDESSSNREIVKETPEDKPKMIQDELKMNQDEVKSMVKEKDKPKKDEPVKDEPIDEKEPAVKDKGEPVKKKSFLDEIDEFIDSILD